MDKQPVRNLFKKTTNSEYEYAVAPKGKVIMGLVSIRDCMIKTQWGEKEGYHLVFRSKENPAAFVNYRQTATLSDRSNLGKALKRMTEAFDEYAELEPEEAYKLLMSCVDEWYEVRIKHNPWKTASGEEIIFANVDDNDIQPAKMPKGHPKPTDYFNERDGLQHVKANQEAAKQISGLEGYPDKGAPTSLEEDDIPGWDDTAVF